MVYFSCTYFLPWAFFSRFFYRRASLRHVFPDEPQNGQLTGHHSKNLVLCSSGVNQLCSPYCLFCAIVPIPHNFDFSLPFCLFLAISNPRFYFVYFSHFVCLILFCLFLAVFILPHPFFCSSPFCPFLGLSRLYSVCCSLCSLIGSANLKCTL